MPIAQAERRAPPDFYQTRNNPINDQRRQAPCGSETPSKAPRRESMVGRTDLGSIHPLALTPPRDGEASVILLAGRSWRVIDVDWPRRRVSVAAAPGEGRARWLGGGRPASYFLCRSAEAVVAGADSGCQLSRRAASKLEQIREQLCFVEGTKIPIVDNGQDNFRIWTFGGGLTNAALAEALPGPTARSDDFCISVKALSSTAAIDAFSKLDALHIGPSISSALIGELKFTSCLPEKIAASTIGARLLDRDGIQATLARKTLAVIRVQ
jgi:ATP-dependent Lhr-like helicase